MGIKISSITVPHTNQLNDHQYKKITEVKQTNKIQQKYHKNLPETVQIVYCIFISLEFN